MDIHELYQHNYAPYSDRPAISVVRSTKGEYFPGIRIENISYPLTISAAQSALFCCLSEGKVPETIFVTDPDHELLPFWKKELDIEVSSLDKKLLREKPLTDVILDDDIDIKKMLENLLDDAIVGESNFPVAALLETENGCFSGVNIECSVWNMGLCAERVAIAKALAYGSTRLKKLHIHTRDGEFSSPCGACRQVIKEHMPNRQVHLHHADHSESIHFSNDLLPYSFSSIALSNK